MLNNNKLSGQIPSGLANVTLLSFFNVSFNNLSGPLPSSNNLMKCSSVLGNPYLHPCRVFTLAVPSPDSPGRASEAQSYTSPSDQSEKNRSGGFTSIEIASIASASAIFSVLLALIFLFIYTRKWSAKSKIMGSARKEVTIFTDIGVPLTFENVVRATGSFNASNCIGNGGFWGPLTRQRSLLVFWWQLKGLQLDDSREFNSSMQRSKPLEDSTIQILSL
ncbi:hypothetical protein OIU78_026207 [Salix suchowensis]|nr:hypothetical protein OIU78_026207 [Salix suchowensis]